MLLYYLLHNMLNMSIDANEAANSSSATFVVPSQVAPVGHDSIALSDSGLSYAAKKLRKRRRAHEKSGGDGNKVNSQEATETETDSETDDTLKITAKNPIDLVTKWPSLGSGKHSPWTRTFHEWFRAISIELAVLRSSKETAQRKLKTLEKENKEKDDQIWKLRKRVDELEKQPTFKPTQSNATTFLWTDMVAGNKKNDAVSAMLAVVKTELKKEDRLLNNIVVSGLAETTDENAKSEEDQKVQKLLNLLEIDASSVKRRTRLRKPGQNPNPLKPSLLLIEFKEQTTAEKAVANARRLVKSEEFKRVYVNRDKTEADRVAEANLRKERNERNKSLPHVMDESRGLRYGIDEKKKKFYWAIRNGELARVIINEENGKGGNKGEILPESTC